MNLRKLFIANNDFGRTSVQSMCTLLLLQHGPMRLTSIEEYIQRPDEGKEYVWINRLVQTLVYNDLVRISSDKNCKVALTPHGRKCLGNLEMKKLSKDAISQIHQIFKNHRRMSPGTLALFIACHNSRSYDDILKRLGLAGVTDLIDQRHSVVKSGLCELYFNEYNTHKNVVHTEEGKKIMSKLITIIG